MNGSDRDFRYVAKTFDAPDLGAEAFTVAIRSRAMPLWQGLREAGLLQSMQTLRKVGDVDLQTAAVPVRDWQYFVLAELCAGVEAEQVLDAERAAGVDVAHFASLGVQFLSDEVFTRPAAAGTAIPVPSQRFVAPPPGQLAAIEYIQIPQESWQDYRRFMKEVMGPVGAHMVRMGHSYQVQILELTQVRFHDATLPPWNRIHILWGQFDDPHDGFFRHTNEAIGQVLGPGLDVQAALDPVSRYRMKPRMSKNRRVEALCF